MIAIAALLLLVWLPLLFFAVRKALRKENRHSKPDRESQSENKNTK